ncbi:MAG: N-acetylmuramoyl-L-alanine amidase [Vicinamibacterales bacterium]
MTAFLSPALRVVTAVALVAAMAPAAYGQGTSARDRYEAARGREAAARTAVERVPPSASTPAIDGVVRPARRVVTAYEGIVRRFPTSGYSDNALLQAGALSQWLYARYGRAADRAAALKYYGWLTREYPSSSLRRQARAGARSLDVPAATRTAAAAEPAPPPAPAAPAVTAPVAPAAAPAPDAGVENAVLLRSIEREVLEETVRITLALDREVPFAHDVIGGPPRAFVDVFGAVAAEALQDATLPAGDDVVRQVRVGRQPNAVRVVLDLDGTPRVSVFTLYNPYRIVVDLDRSARATAPPAPVTRAAVATAGEVVLTDETAMSEAPAAPAAALAEAAAGANGDAPAPARAAEPQAPAAPAPAPPAVTSAGTAVNGRSPAREAPAARTPAPSPAGPPPAVPSRNADGTFSMARQLGLGVSRIVIDAGHGGRDPGTPTSGSTEARIVLDIALRLEKLLVKEGFDVVLTRRTDVYIPLEERTAIANREGADLFLSIHANSGRDPKARGVEVYYLSFASNPEAEAVAARENATSTGGMHSLPSVVRAIALNNKLDESRDLAQMVQQSLATRLVKPNPAIRNRGVKKAPFVVLIGAQMPSVLAEIGFITNRQEVALLKTPAYRQRVAESLRAAVVQYQRSLKRDSAVASR